MRHHHLNPEAGTHRVLGAYQKSSEPYSAELLNLVTGQHKKILHLEQKLNRANAFAERTKKRLAVLDSLLKVDEISEY